MRKAMLKLFLLLISVQLFTFSVFAHEFSGEEFKMDLFYTNSCPFCIQLREELNSLNYYDKFHITEYEVSGNEENKNLYLNKALEVGYTGGNVPLLINKSEFIEGKDSILNYLNDLNGNSVAEVDSAKLNELLDEQLSDKDAKEIKKIAMNESGEAKSQRNSIIIGLIFIFAFILIRQRKMSQFKKLIASQTQSQSPRHKTERKRR